MLLTVYGKRLPPTDWGDAVKRVYANAQVCMACHLCEVYCRQAHSPSSDLASAYSRGTLPAVAAVRVDEKRPVSFAVQCRHCDEPACVYACLAGALSKDPVTGVVSVDAERCVGCWTCVLACPVGAPRQDFARGKMVKCDLCQGCETPACVANCPNEALIYGEVELEAQPCGPASRVAVASVRMEARTG